MSGSARHDPGGCPARYAAFYHALSPESVEDLRGLCIEGVRFRDPFNDFTVEKMVALFHDMYRQVEAPFRGDGSSARRRGLLSALDDEFPPQGLLWIEGLTEVHFDAEGQVVAHIDHWDLGSQFYAKLPLLGAVVRWISRKLAV